MAALTSERDGDTSKHDGGLAANEIELRMGDTDAQSAASRTRNVIIAGVLA